MGFQLPIWKITVVPSISWSLEDKLYHCTVLYGGWEVRGWGESTTKKEIQIFSYNEDKNKTKLKTLILLHYPLQTTSFETININTNFENLTLNFYVYYYKNYSTVKLVGKCYNYGYGLNSSFCFACKKMPIVHISSSVSLPSLKDVPLYSECK